MPILHGMDLKCGKKYRSEFIGIMDALLFLYLYEAQVKQVVQNKQSVRE
jgi:hypothetical protein